VSLPDPASDRRGHRLAAIDVGTNSIRLVVADVSTDRTIRLLDDEKVPTRLGRGLAAGAGLSEPVMEDSAQALAHLRSIAEGYEVEALRAVATCAVREAPNRETFTALVRERAGLNLEIVSAEDEARLAFLGVKGSFDLRDANAAVVDVGGGSTEIVLSSGSVIERVCPLDLGAVRLTERLGIQETPSREQYRELRRTVRRRLRKSVGKPPFSPHLLIGTGGTFTKLAAISMHRGSKGQASDVLPFAVRGYEMQRSELKHILNQLRKMTVRERAQVPGLNPERADIIVAGLAIIDGIMKQLGINRLRVHDHGLRAGLLHAMIDEICPAPATPACRMRSVEQFAAACGHEHRHARQVAALAVQIFDAMARECGEDAFWATPQHREHLQAAALLHDIGYLINYAKHHKHSYHLIVHSELPGFSRPELELIANIARYHRGARPKSAQATFARLDGEDQAVVRRLAGILRIAVGLDRSHTQRVRNVDIRCADGLAIFAVGADGDPAVELWGAQRKTRLFESAFGVTARFVTDPPPTGGPLDRTHGAIRLLRESG
jgi:exopolyphosphatase/guanosine-5'-triphosphate,3'-diphosphate pyrophosphatase